MKAVLTNWTHSLILFFTTLSDSLFGPDHEGRGLNSKSTDPNEKPLYKIPRLGR
jgi:hypothetical protein